MPTANNNTAEQAAEVALSKVLDCIERRKDFVLEAGAGAGKTHSLIETLRHIIEKQGDTLLRSSQQIACITYTNVAKAEIEQRTDGHPAILAETIHAFCWGLLKDFQPYLRTAILELDRWPQRLADAGVEVAGKIVRYDLGYPSVRDDTLFLHHDDVIALMVKLMEKPKFRAIITKRFPVILIDEYQDTAKNFATALQSYFLDTDEGPLLGFFGDHWQKIYGTGCGIIESANLERIDKGANFRSDKAVVGVLNRMRPELIQIPKSAAAEGEATAYHTNGWQGARRTELHWRGDLPVGEPHAHLERLRTQLESDGWDMSKTKILMLTHNVLADEQGYRNLANVFSHNESFIKKEDDYIKFLAEVVEPVCQAYEARRFGEMFSILGRKSSMRNHAEKLQWVADMDGLLEQRRTGTIGQIIDYLKQTRKPRLPEKIDYKESRLSLLSDPESTLTDEERRSLERIQQLRGVGYSELAALTRYINEKTPFSTKHNVKGAEFDNVLVVLGRGWNHYDFGQMLAWMPGSVPNGKEDVYERNCNLFYVCCSRPKHRLALLFTQELTQDALQTLTTLFGGDAVRPCP